MSKISSCLLVCGLYFLSSCSRKPTQDFISLTSEFVHTLLSFSPVAATSAGYHEHHGVRLDEQLDDLTVAGRETQRGFYLNMRARLNALDRNTLPAQDRADYALMQDLISLGLAELDTLQAYRNNPTLYVEVIGNALFTPFVLDYAPLPQRMRHILARVEKIPVFLENAKKQLVEAPEVWNRVAREENEGNIALIDKTIRERVPADIEPAYDKAADKALEALQDFNTWLEKHLSKHTSEWRLGPQKYALKFTPSLGLDASPDQVLSDAEAFLHATRKQMFDIARPLYSKLGSKGDPTDINHVIRTVLTDIATEHSTAETYLPDARRDLDEIRVFVRNSRLLELPLRDNLKLIPTPEFMRGIYSVGGFNAAPALEPHLGAFYWITPIPPNWPKDRIESKLSEYNNYGLKLLTIHEAMPGHYVQLEYANQVQPPARRLLRSVFGNGPYVEGWAVYATEATLDAGYLNSSPQLRLTFLKQQLRVVSNAILDIRLHTRNMSEEDAMALMLVQTFQEKEEATAKLQRAKLSSAQLPTYYTGYREWIRVRDEFQARRVAAPSLYDFHDKALRQGAVPMRTLSPLLLAK